MKYALIISILLWGLILSVARAWADTSILKEDHAPILIDQQGKLIFVCKSCPNKFCKEMACVFYIDIKTGKQIANCECREDRK